MRTLLTKINQVPFVINDVRDCFLFMLLGGHGIIRKELAEEYFPLLITKKPVAPLGSKLGFVSVTSVSPSKFVKRPRPRIKKNVRARDGYKCKICSRCESDGAKLTLHHITMRKWGGFTEESNLILICGDCHDELDDFNNYAMYDLIGVNRFVADKGGQEFRNSVARYRLVSFAEFRKQNDASNHKHSTIR
jgi:hypothetical protein